jgi:hypothetical protein
MLNQITTKQLSDELSGREGVSKLVVEPHSDIKIIAGGNEQVIQGPAIIFINQD